MLARQRLTRQKTGQGGQPKLSLEAERGRADSTSSASSPPSSPRTSALGILTGGLFPTTPKLSTNKELKRHTSGHGTFSRKPDAAIHDNRDTEVWNSWRMSAEHPEKPLDPGPINVKDKAVRAALKKKCRHGVLEAEMRRRTWLAILGIENDSDEYRESVLSYRLLFRDKIKQCPGCAELHSGHLHRFGARFLSHTALWDENVFDKHALNESGVLAAKRLLFVINAKWNLQYAPQIPDLVCLLLLYLSEEETFAAVNKILSSSRRGTRWSKDRDSSHHFLPIGRIESHVFVRTFIDLFRERLPVLHRNLGELARNEEEIELLFLCWFERLFVCTLPLRYVIRVLDSFIVEGAKVLYRIGLTLLKNARTTLLESCARYSRGQVNLRDLFFECLVEIGSRPESRLAVRSQRSLLQTASCSEQAAAAAEAEAAEPAPAPQEAASTEAKCDQSPPNIKVRRVCSATVNKLSKDDEGMLSVRRTSSSSDASGLAQSAADATRARIDEEEEKAQEEPRSAGIGGWRRRASNMTKLEVKPPGREARSPSAEAKSPNSPLAIGGSRLLNAMRPLERKFSGSIKNLASPRLAPFNLRKAGNPRDAMRRGRSKLLQVFDLADDASKTVSSAQSHNAAAATLAEEEEDGEEEQKDVSPVHAEGGKACPSAKNAGTQALDGSPVAAEVVEEDEDWLMEEEEFETGFVRPADHSPEPPVIKPAARVTDLRIETKRDLQGLRTAFRHTKQVAHDDPGSASSNSVGGEIESVHTFDMADNDFGFPLRFETSSWSSSQLISTQPREDEGDDAVASRDVASPKFIKSWDQDQPRSARRHVEALPMNELTLRLRRPSHETIDSKEEENIIVVQNRFGGMRFYSENSLLRSSSAAGAKMMHKVVGNGPDVHGLDSVHDHFEFKVFLGSAFSWRNMSSKSLLRKDELNRRSLPSHPGSLFQLGDDTMTAHFPQSFIPTSSTVSSIDMATRLVSWLPVQTRHMASKMRLLYSSEIHGRNLRTLYEHSNQDNIAGSILLIESLRPDGSQGSVFGAYHPGVFRNTAEPNPGDETCFLFRLGPSHKAEAWRFAGSVDFAGIAGGKRTPRARLRTFSKDNEYRTGGQTNAHSHSQQDLKRASEIEALTLSSRFAARPRRASEFVPSSHQRMSDMAQDSDASVKVIADDEAIGTEEMAAMQARFAAAMGDAMADDSADGGSRDHGGFSPRASFDNPLDEVEPHMLDDHIEQEARINFITCAFSNICFGTSSVIYVTKAGRRVDPEDIHDLSDEEIIKMDLRKKKAGPGLSLASDLLTGHTGWCNTYANEPLCLAEDCIIDKSSKLHRYFRIASVEVFGIPKF